MSEDWQDSPTMKAAALEGISENRAFPLDDRLKCAQQAIALLRGHIESLEDRQDRVLALATEASKALFSDGIDLGRAIVAIHEEH